MIRRSLLTISTLVLLAACHPSPVPGNGDAELANEQARARSAAEKETRDTLRDVGMQALETRVGKLEQDVATLQARAATPVLPATPTIAPPPPAVIVPPGKAPKLGYDTH